MEELHRRLMPLLDNHHTSRLTYRASCEGPKQGKKPFIARLSILDAEKDSSNVQECVPQSIYRGYPHLSPSSETLHHFLGAYAISALGTQCSELYKLLASRIEKTSPKLLLVCTKCICIREMNEILIVIDVVCEVSKFPETPSDVIL